MPDAHKNFAYSTVAVAPAPPDTGLSLTVAAGHGARFPATPFNATIWPAAVLPEPTNAEIVRVTSIVGDVLTIVRAQEGSTARSVVVGDQIAATVTVKTLTDVEDAVSVVSQALSVETAARVAGDNALSNAVSVVSQALSAETVARTTKDDALSQAVSVVSQALSVETAARVAADAGLSLRVTSADAHAETASAAATSADAHAGTASAAATSVDGRVTSVNAALSAISARSVGGVSTHGLQSVVDALSNRISAGGGAGSVTSAELQAVSAQAASALSQALSALSVTDAALSAGIVSVDARVASVNTFLCAISARSLAVSTHGLQSVVDALSNRISVEASARVATDADLANMISNVASVLGVRIDVVSQGLSALSNANSAAHVSLEAHASAASAAATSVNARLDAVSALSVGVAVAGLQSAINALSNTISNEASVRSVGDAAVSAQAASALSQEASVRSAADAALSDRIDLIPGGGSVPAIRVVAAAQVISSTGLTNVSGLSVSVSAGKTYRLEAIVMANRGTTSAPIRWGLTFPAMTLTRGRIRAPFSAPGPTSLPAVALAGLFNPWAGNSASGSLIINNVTSSIAFISTFAEYAGLFVVSTTGVIQLQAGASTGTAAVTILAGSYIRAWKLN